MGIWTLIFGGMMPLGSLQAGLMADFLGTPATIAIGALICALAAVVTFEVVRKREARTLSNMRTKRKALHLPSQWKMNGTMNSSSRKSISLIWYVFAISCVGLAIATAGAQNTPAQKKNSPFFPPFQKTPFWMTREPWRRKVAYWKIKI